MGAFTQSIAMVTVYATLGMDAIMEVVMDNIIPMMVCNKKDVLKLIQNVSKMPMLQYIVYTNDLVSPNEAVAEIYISIKFAAAAHVMVILFDNFVAMGDTKAFPPIPLEPKPVLWPCTHWDRPANPRMSLSNMPILLPHVLPSRLVWDFGKVKNAIWPTCHWHTVWNW